MSSDTSKIRNVSRWLALACLVVPMFGSYFFDDMFSSLSQLFHNPELLELGWNSADYGFYAGGYSFLCVWGGLIVCGMLRQGHRFDFRRPDGCRSRHRHHCHNIRNVTEIFTRIGIRRLYDFRARK